ncbi:hypothetical protein MRX96_057085 [Rhipicephalus microplus]
MRPAKRLKPSDAEERAKSPVLPVKSLAQAITEPQAQQAGSLAGSMVCDEKINEKGSHAVPSQATIAELERAAVSGEGGKYGENGARSASGDDEAEEDVASAVSLATVEDMLAPESGAEGVSVDGKDDHPAACKESQAERKPSFKGKSAPRSSPAVRGTWWDKKGVDVPHGRDALQTTYEKNFSSSAKQ